MTPPNLYFAIAYTLKKGRSEVVRQIQAYAAELDGCLVSEDGIRRILQAREAIVISCPHVARETVLDIFEAELPCGGAAYPPVPGLQCVIS
ncbi:hypothetical protein HR13_10245 [Porphyromonas gulae]|nr:hypothetical protein HR13_10245 [Porphyromonas gulae]